MLTDPIVTVTDTNEKQKLMNVYHNDPLIGGHCGRRKLYAKLRTKYFWKNMSKDTAIFVKNCSKCNVNKVRPGNKEELVLTPTPIKPFDIVVVALRLKALPFIEKQGNWVPYELKPRDVKGRFCMSEMLFERYKN